ncbi:MAG: MerR family transcriptional regulator [Deltaproteobacteria bacterium]|nr:MerR family transcriptional regulator [Deltaproteobacteria bacterium]
MSQIEKRYFSIKIVSETLGVHPQAIRLYEREGLITSMRCGAERYYALSQIERLRVIIQLRRDLGINLAGIEVILNMRDRLRELSHFAADRQPSDHLPSVLPAPAKAIKISVRDES